MPRLTACRAFLNCAVKQGFRILKDKPFRNGEFLLKKPPRIQALAMIMALCIYVSDCFPPSDAPGQCPPDGAGGYTTKDSLKAGGCYDNEFIGIVSLLI
ncbi:MAG TPA: hypothetical protein PLN56_04575 [Methanoregulaceae archaeon]|nr:MAG: hypothetical protein IPI71_03075 [Methanolinea sp.]HON81058.1 hypothetical protein [Methanoregulaceae archaeon]HPD10257.1 hypothetical protein [Methanoregulaceae archaeon]HRT14644.1 hypothetical protein [Methanoregulaceae archaeon]HRU30215.1 hypothetical protein [Methanoregulaceae archaeon]